MGFTPSISSPLKTDCVICDLRLCLVAQGALEPPV